VSGPAWDKSDTKLLFELLFDLKALLAKIAPFVEGGDDDGMEEEEADEP
jgi:hypothetical protein